LAAEQQIAALQAQRLGTIIRSHVNVKNRSHRVLL
jgi:hypothetical protein